MSATPQPAGISLPITEGATAIPERAVFETLARRDDVPGALGVREVKLLMLGVDGDALRLYFLNTMRYVYHYDFAVEALGLTLSLGEFNRQTYFRDARRNLAGTVLAHDRFEDDEGTPRPVRLGVLADGSREGQSRGDRV
ncbi:MAG: hypothetical protein ACRDZO_12570 [Egibacteraceae bacterium]